MPLLATALALLIQQQIEAKHPMPFRRVGREQFHAAMDKAGDDRMAMMRAVAMLRDGHTALLPDFDRWFPIRFYALTDGLFVTAVDKRFPHLAGAKVLRIGNRTAEEAMRDAESMFASDNEFRAKEAAALLSSAQIAKLDVLPLDVQLRDGTTAHVDIPSFQGRAGFDWIQWGEMYGPPGTELVTAFEKDPPLHLKSRQAYWFTALDRAVYVQINAMADRSKVTPETFVQFVERLFAYVDLHPVEKLIFDIRYNGGGNGRLIRPIVHALIKREDRGLRLYVISGRKTFSAGLGLLIALRQETNAILAGEPPGAAMNAAGDPDTVALEGVHLSVSTNYFVGAKFRDDSAFIPVQIPAPFSSADYFGGRDPALEAILAPDAVTILDALSTRGGAAAKALYERRKALYGALPWWEPFERIAMNGAGLTLLEQGKTTDAVAALEMNVDRYPNTWETWDSLAEALMAAKENARAIAAYERALALNPDNWNAEAEKKAIAAMRATARP
ncbi:MAG TPA: tetratricopeptide repeat protein [Thermoanaerobaculia bacterium]|jgi:hypothetical protein